MGANRAIEVIDVNVAGEPLGAPRIVVPASALEGKSDRYRSWLGGVVAQRADMPIGWLSFLPSRMFTEGELRASLAPPHCRHS